MLKVHIKYPICDSWFKTNVENLHVNIVNVKRSIALKLFKILNLRLGVNYELVLHLFIGIVMNIKRNNKTSLKYQDMSVRTSKNG